MKVSTATSIGQLDEDRWDALAGEQIVMTHRWQRVMETSRSAYEPRYLLAEDDHGPLLGLVANTNETFGRSGWREAALRRLSLVVAASFSSQHTGLMLRGGTPVADALPVLERLLGQLCWREQRLVVGFSNVSSAEVDRWQKRGFIARAQPVSMTLALPTSSYADYLAELSPGDRRELRRARRRAAALDVSFAHAPLHALERTEDLFPMYEEICARHGGAPGDTPFTPALFSSLEREMPGEVMVFSGSVAGQPAGYFLCLLQGQTLLVILAGLHYALAFPSSLYFVLLDEIVQWSLGQNIRTIHAGLTNETQKRRHGFRPQARWFCFRAYPGALNRALHAIPLHAKDH